MQKTGYSYGAKTRAYRKVAKTVKVNKNTVRNWVDNYETMKFITESSRGRHSKTRSPIIEDPQFKAEFKEFVKNNSRKPGKIFINLLVSSLICKVSHTMRGLVGSLLGCCMGGQVGGYVAS